MILTSILFLLLVIPTDTYTLQTSVGGSTTAARLGIAVDTLYSNSLVFLSYLNSSINFISYFVTGRKFRMAALDTITCRRSRQAMRPMETLNTGVRSSAVTDASSQVTLSNLNTSIDSPRE